MRSWLFPARGRKSFSEPPFWSLDALRYPYLAATLPDRERIEHDFEGYVHGAYKTDGIVFACIAARMALFSQARFQWREFRAGRPGDLYGSAELALLERPWPNGTTGNLLALMETDVSLAGNFYATVADDAGRLGVAATGSGRRVVRMRPDWVTIIIGSRTDDGYALDAKPVGYLYEPMAYGLGTRAEPVLLTTGEVCHYAPQPDPAARFRGMSWLTPILREIDADKSATEHKRRFFVNGATLQTVIKFDREVPADRVAEFAARMDATHKGEHNAYRTLVLGAGADATVVGTDLRQLDFKATQGAGETRIAAVAGVHPVIVGLSEGLQGSSLNAGNFNAARRLLADKTLRWLWSEAAASLQTLVTPPNPRAQLWYDGRDVAFLREDQKDAAEILKENMLAIESGIRGGYTPESVRDAVTSGDLTLMQHTGLFSVQLQPAGADQPDRGTPEGGPGGGG